MKPPHKLREHVPLAPWTTLQVGGPARWFLQAESEEEIVEARAWARHEGVPVTVLGGGSNLLVADKGIDGLVLRIATRGIAALPTSTEGMVRLRVSAGESLDALVERTVNDDLQGLECLSGIPGSVGATPIQNVGAYGQEVSETIVAVEVLERASGSRETIPADGCAFGYRSSVFKKDWRDRYVVLAVHFELRRGGRPSLRYGELARHLASRGTEAPSLREIREAVLTLRRAKSMVIDPDDPNGRSAGSFFVNPVVPTSLADEIARSLGPEGSSMPRFEAPAGVKLSAAWLIERAGFLRGTSDGAVGLSTRHALAVVNRGDAKAAEVVAFAARIRAAVRSKFGVALSPEPEMVGFDRSEIADLVG